MRLLVPAARTFELSRTRLSSRWPFSLDRAFLAVKKERRELGGGVLRRKQAIRVELKVERDVLFRALVLKFFLL